MLVAPSPSAVRGEVVLQPAYFTSSVYCNPLRNDIMDLIHAYHDLYHKSQPVTKPFALFKSIWEEKGWNWMQFKVLDHRSRETFLNVTMRLFLERMVKTEPPFSRVVALFGLYTFFNTQPSGSAPPLYSVSNIPIPIDQYTALISLPSTVTAAYLQPLQTAASHVLDSLLQAQIFFILPSSELGTSSPRNLPRETFLDDNTMIPMDPNAPKKKGRPSKHDKARKAKAAVDSLDRWLQKTSYPPENATGSGSAGIPPTHQLLMNPPKSTLYQYQSHKIHMLNTIDTPGSDGRAAIVQANHDLLARLKELKDRDPHIAAIGNGLGLQRVERAVQEMNDPSGQPAGLLGLLEGAGRRRQ